MAQAEHTFITRRRLMAASAALVPAASVTSLPAPALSLPVPAPSITSTSPIDPIFAAIAAHERVYGDLLALFAAQDAADKALQQATAHTRAELQARLDELIEAEGPLGLLEMDASKRLVTTIPQTLAGVLAALRYVRELFERDEYPLCEEDGYLALLFSAECALQRNLQT